MNSPQCSRCKCHYAPDDRCLEGLCQVCSLDKKNEDTENYILGLMPNSCSRGFCH